MLKLKDIKKDYLSGDAAVHALKGINLTFRESEFVAILGHSGCGKTTLLNIVGGLDKYSSGDLIINGKSTKNFTDADWDAYRNHSIGFVFQSFNLVPVLNVMENILLPLELDGAKTDKEHIAKIIEMLDLKEQTHKLPTQLSGGQQQRVAIARALAGRPSVILADEPTGNLDSRTSQDVMSLFRVTADKFGQTMVMITHNTEIAQTADRIIRIEDGLIVNR